MNQKSDTICDINFSCKTPPSRVARAPTSRHGVLLQKLLLCRSPHVNGDVLKYILESRIAAMCIEEGGAYASAIGQESREDKLENAELQNQIGGRSVTLGHHPTRTRADAKPSKRKRMAQKRPVRKGLVP